MSDRELLPCPFCGANGIPQVYARIIYAFIEHDDSCPLSGSLPTLDSWNVRAQGVNGKSSVPVAWMYTGPALVQDKLFSFQLLKPLAEGWIETPLFAGEGHFEGQGEKP